MRENAIGVIAVNGRALLLAVLPCEQLVQTLVLRQSVQLLDLPERIERQQLRVGVHDDGAFFVFDDDVSRVLDVQGRKIFLVHLFEVDDDHHGTQRLAAMNDVVHQRQAVVLGRDAEDRANAAGVGGGILFQVQ